MPSDEYTLKDVVDAIRDLEQAVHNEAKKEREEIEGVTNILDSINSAVISIDLKMD